MADSLYVATPLQKPRRPGIGLRHNKMHLQVAISCQSDWREDIVALLEPQAYLRAYLVQHSERWSFSCLIMSYVEHFSAGLSKGLGMPQGLQALQVWPVSRWPTHPENTAQLCPAGSHARVRQVRTEETSAPALLAVMPSTKARSSQLVEYSSESLAVPLAHLQQAEVDLGK